MTTNSYQAIENLEADLWSPADNLRKNSKLPSSDYFVPVLGVIFLRQVANHFAAASNQIEEDQASGKMPALPMLPEDYLRRRALRLPEHARYAKPLLEQAIIYGPRTTNSVSRATCCCRG